MIFSFNKKKRARKIVHWDTAFFYIKNLKIIFKKLEELSIRNYKIALLSKYPIFFLKNDKYFIKILKKSEAPRADFYSNSFKINSILYNLNSYNFPKPEKCLDDGVFLYYIAENIDAKKLNKNTLKRIKAFSSKDKGILLSQLKDIISLLTDCKILHFDLYAYNILLNEDKKRLVLIDFDTSFLVENNHHKIDGDYERLEKDIKRFSKICDIFVDTNPVNLKLREDIASILNNDYRALLKPKYTQVKL